MHLIKTFTFTGHKMDNKIMAACVWTEEEADIIKY